MGGKGSPKQLLKQIDDDEKGEWKEIAEKIFEEIDKDKSGALEKEEYKSVMELLTAHAEKKYDWCGIDTPGLKELIQTNLYADLDPDSDGKITKEEFVENVKKFLDANDAPGT